jgi:hypothetical protein
MCYEERFYTERADRKARKREQPKSFAERRPPESKPDQLKRAPRPPEEVERERELEIV